MNIFSPSYSSSIFTKILLHASPRLCVSTALLQYFATSNFHSIFYWSQWAYFVNNQVIKNYWRSFLSMKAITCRRSKPLALKLLLDPGRWNDILIRASKYAITEWRRTNATQQTRNQIDLFNKNLYISKYIFGFSFVVWHWFFFTTKAIWTSLSYR